MFPQGTQRNTPEGGGNDLMLEAQEPWKIYFINYHNTGLFHLNARLLCAYECSHCRRSTCRPMTLKSDAFTINIFHSSKK